MVFREMYVHVELSSVSCELYRRHLCMLYVLYKGMQGADTNFCRILCSASAFCVFCRSCRRDVWVSLSVRGMGRLCVLCALSWTL